MKMRSWSESNGAMLVPSTFTGWYKNTMMTSASPMAMSRSRVQTRISLRRECIDATRPVMALATDGPEFTMGDDAGVRVSGDVEVARSFSFGRSILTLPCIYSMAVARRARCDLRGLSAEQEANPDSFTQSDSQEAVARCSGMEALVARCRNFLGSKPQADQSSPSA